MERRGALLHAVVVFGGYLDLIPSVLRFGYGLAKDAVNRAPARCCRCRTRRTFLLAGRLYLPHHYPVRATTCVYLPRSHLTDGLPYPLPGYGQQACCLFITIPAGRFGISGTLMSLFATFTVYAVARLYPRDLRRRPTLTISLTPYFCMPRITAGLRMAYAAARLPLRFPPYQTTLLPTSWYGRGVGIPSVLRS